MSRCTGHGIRDTGHETRVDLRFLVRRLSELGSGKATLLPQTRFRIQHFQFRISDSCAQTQSSTFHLRIAESRTPNPEPLIPYGVSHVPFQFLGAAK